MYKHSPRTYFFYLSLLAHYPVPPSHVYSNLPCILHDWYHRDLRPGGQPLGSRHHLFLLVIRVIRPRLLLWRGGTHRLDDRTLGRRKDRVRFLVRVRVHEGVKRARAGSLGLQWLAVLVDGGLLHSLHLGGVAEEALSLELECLLRPVSLLDGAVLRSVARLVAVLAAGGLEGWTAKLALGVAHGMVGPKGLWQASILADLAPLLGRGDLGRLARHVVVVVVDGRQLYLIYLCQKAFQFFTGIDKIDIIFIMVLKKLKSFSR